MTDLPRPQYFAHIVMIAAIVVIGLLAGLYLGTGLAQFSNQTVAYDVWVPRQQAEVGLFRHFMPQFSLAATILPALAAILFSGLRRWLFAIAAALILGTILSTSLGEIPLNGMVLGWDPDVIVPGWEKMRASWLDFHWIKTAMSIVAFTSATAAAALRR